MNSESKSLRTYPKAAVCDLLNISSRTLENMVKAGKFPPPVRLGKQVYWSEVAVQKWQVRLFSAQDAWEARA
jgi:predicted DNA-binding transcriptional regulator AlpA